MCDYENGCHVHSMTVVKERNPIPLFKLLGFTLFCCTPEIWQWPQAYLSICFNQYISGTWLWKTDKTAKASYKSGSLHQSWKPWYFWSIHAILIHQLSKPRIYPQYKYLSKWLLTLIKKLVSLLIKKPFWNLTFKHIATNYQLSIFSCKYILVIILLRMNFLQNNHHQGTYGEHSKCTTYYRCASSKLELFHLKPTLPLWMFPKLSRGSVYFKWNRPLKVLPISKHACFQHSTHFKKITTTSSKTTNSHQQLQSFPTSNVDNQTKFGLKDHFGFKI